MVKREDLCRTICRKAGVSRPKSRQPGQLSRKELAMLNSHLDVVHEELERLRAVKDRRRR